MFPSRPNLLFLQACEHPSLVNCCSGGSQGRESSGKWITRTTKQRKGPDVQNAWTNCVRSHTQPGRPGGVHAWHAWLTQAGPRARAPSFISLHSFCRQRPRSLSDRAPPRAPVSLDTGLGDQGRAVPAEQQQATEEEHPPFPPTRPELGRRPRDAGASRSERMRAGARAQSRSACVRVPARPPHVTRRPSPALGARRAQQSRTAQEDVRVRARRVVGRGAVAPPPLGPSPSARRRPLRLRHLNRASAIFPASVGQARRLFWKVSWRPGGPGPGAGGDRRVWVSLGWARGGGCEESGRAAP